MENEWRLIPIWRIPEEQDSAGKYIVDIKQFQLRTDTLRGICVVGCWFLPDISQQQFICFTDPMDTNLQ